jgi:adenylate cyclase
MHSEFTAQLVVENVGVQAEPGSAHSKNIGSPVHARRLLAVGEHQPGWSNESPLVGRVWKLNTVTAILDEAVGGTGCVVNVMVPGMRQAV